MRRLAVLAWVVAGLVPVAAAQSGSPDAAEAAALRQRLEAPRPAVGTDTELRRHFIEQTDVARRLGDVAAIERVLRDAIQAQPQNPRWRSELGLVLRDAGRYDDAVLLFDQALSLTQHPPSRLFFESNRLSVPVRRTAEALARDALDLRSRAQAMLPGLRPGTDRLSVLRALASTYIREGESLARRGLFADALPVRQGAVAAYREAFSAAQALQPPSFNLVQLAAHNLVGAQRDLAAALARMGQHAQAEQQLDEVQRFAHEQGLSAIYAATVHHVRAGLRMRRGEWDDAERQLRLSIQVLDGMRYARSHPFHTARTRDLLLVLWAAGRDDAAMRELDSMDQAVQRDGIKGRGRYPFERGLVLLAAGRHPDAGREFAALERHNRAEAGGEHFYTAQSQALRGVALWHGGDVAQRAAAANALEAGVASLLAPRNADFTDDANARRKLRTLIFNAYLEAMAWRGGAKAVAALGVADRLLAGATGQAMTDAALRSAASQPALADLLRREQDGRLLAQGLLDELREGEGAEESRRPDDQAQAVRQRLGEAESRLQATRDELRSRFPEFDRLLRPQLATPAEVARLLARDEMLLLALPTERALYLWAVVPDGPASFVRVDVTRERLREQVQRLREGLDFEAGGGRTPRFDHALSHELYRTVLAPVAAALQGRRQLVVATTGPLASLPFAALATTPNPGAADGWLAHQLASSQVPSVAAWLALRQLPVARQAPEALMAWADPTYGLAAKPASRIATTTGGRSAEAAGLKDLPALPETRDEARAIARSLKANPEQDLLLGPRATRDSVLAASRSGELARKRVVVFATHGLSAGDLPGLAQPALALATTAADSHPLASLIGLDDILSLKLNADWVVLSACNTAGADGRVEESLSGLARGFLYAGSRSLLVTHWAVETESAKLLTTATFEHQAANPQSSKAESLRQAMLKVMANPKYAHPAFWAPFALVGNGAR